MSKDPHFIFIVGATGTGKSQFAMDLAKTWQAPIANFDSLQVYKSVDIGTAKPTSSERAEIPHFLFDYVGPPRKLTAADYVKDVEKLIAEKKLESKVVFVGGSGFYLQALERGVFPGVETSDEIRQSVQDWINEKGFASLYEWLTEKDPRYAEKISPKDHYRVRRAVEVIRSQNKKVSELHELMKMESQSVLPAHKKRKLGFLFEKEELRERLHLRAEKMIEKGFIDEVLGLRKRGFSDWAPLKSVGYKEVGEFLDGNLSREELVPAITQSSMQLVKKQMTWFKKDSEIQWYKMGQREEVLEELLNWAKG